MNKLRAWIKSYNPIQEDLIGRRRLVFKNILIWIGVCGAVFIFFAGIVPTAVQISKGSDPYEKQAKGVNITSSESEKADDSQEEGKGLWDNSLGRLNERLQAKRQALPEKEVSLSDQVLRRKDGSYSLPPGTKLIGEVKTRVLAATDPVPVDILVKKVKLPSGAIRFPPHGSVVLAEAKYSTKLKRAMIRPRHLVLASRETMNLQGRGESRDGTLGITGQIHNEKAKNLAGSYLAHFIGGASRGAINQGWLGKSEVSNPWTNALVSGAGEVAKEEGERLAQELQKEVTIIEVKKGAKVVVRLDQPLDWSW